ncbi:MAG TPA: TldD/PmbA family protein [Candidatus Thermoplasmatota archaeon]|nr:TldD/PmbA family protein [Candidatus Thermoplasmatota archaeon]
MPTAALDALADPAERALRLALRAGLEGEVRAERTVERVLATHGGQLTAATSTEGGGVGVRVLHRGRAGYASTTDPTPAELSRIVGEAARMAGARTGRRAVAVARSAAALAAPGGDDADLEAKLDLLRRAARAGQEAGKEVAAVVAGYQERLGARVVLRTDGARCAWEPRAVTLDVSVVSRAGQGLAKGRAFHGGSFGLEGFTGEQGPEALAQRAAQWAAERRDARRPRAGKQRVLADPLLAGVLAHESFGHLAEGDLVRSGWSVLRGREGARLGSTHATIVDTGLPPEGAGGIALPFDDEATPSREVTILDRGRLAGFLHGRTTGATTGNARAVDYRFAPICRMRNTFFRPSDLRLDEAIEQLRDGIYACGSTGGEARSDGNFVFTAVRAYRVERGRVAEPLRDVALAGNILRALRGVEGCTRELVIHAGANVSCGKWGQWPLPVGYGGPHVLLGEVLAGGEGTTWEGAR